MKNVMKQYSCRGTCMAETVQHYKIVVCITILMLSGAGWQHRILMLPEHIHTYTYITMDCVLKYGTNS